MHVRYSKWENDDVGLIITHCIYPYMVNGKLPGSTCAVHLGHRVAIHVDTNVVIPGCVHVQYMYTCLHVYVHVSKL